MTEIDSVIADNEDYKAMTVKWCSWSVDTHCDPGLLSSSAYKGKEGSFPLLLAQRKHTDSQKHQKPRSWYVNLQFFRGIAPKYDRPHTVVRLCECFLTSDYWHLWSMVNDRWQADRQKFPGNRRAAQPDVSWEAWLMDGFSSWEIHRCLEGWSWKLSLMNSGWWFHWHLSFSWIFRDGWLIKQYFS